MSASPPPNNQPVRSRRGGVKYVLLHHGHCPGGLFHYRIDAQGTCRAELPEAQRGQHPRSIGVALDGDFDAAPPTSTQLAALRALLLQLKLRYPDCELGAHRQVRGAAKTTCPGRRFPLQALLAWSRSDLPRLRDESQRRSFEEQYSRI